MAAATQVPVVNSADLSPSGQSILFQDSTAAKQASGDAAVLPKQRRDHGYPAPNVRVEIVAAADAPNPRPTNVLFAGLHDPTLQVRRAFPLEVNVEESMVVVSWPEIDEFGTGENLSCALDDFSHTVRELYHYLHAKNVKPGTDLLRVREVLSQYIEPRTK